MQLVDAMIKTNLAAYNSGHINELFEYSIDRLATEFLFIIRENACRKN